MARHLSVKVEAKSARRQSMLDTYGLVSNKLTVYKVQPWTKEQLAEASERARSEQVWLQYQAARSRDMARHIEDTVRTRGGAVINEKLVLEASFDALRQRANGNSVGITLFERGAEWEHDDPTKNGAKSAQGTLARFLEANKFSVAKSSKFVDESMAGIQVMGYKGTIPEASLTE